MAKWRALDDYEHGRLELPASQSVVRERSEHDPIDDFSEDRLGRTDFAKLLARSLAGTSERSSVVVALYGDWGSGKTSTLNLCLKAMEEAQDSEVPVTVSFAPWWYSNTGELLSRFFEQVGDALEQEGFEGIREDLLSYRDLIVPVAALADMFFTGGFVVGGAWALKAAADRTAQNRETADLYTLKSRIGDRIVASGRRIVLIIDDIDRLSATEIRDIFKLVKVMADFPNTRYLLAFDFNTATEALAEVQQTDGAAYLEKIVQAPFRLPDPAPGLLMDLVITQVQEIMSQEQKVSEEEQAKTKEKLEEMSFYGLGDLWTNMRRVNRVLENFRFTLSAVAGEVRLSDFFLLEALRVAEPRAYERILGRQGFLLGTTSEVNHLSFTASQGSKNSQEEANEATKTAVGAVQDAASRPEVRSAIAEVIDELFPRAQAARGRSVDQSGDRWISEKRVCVSEFFRVATTLGLVSGMISGTEVSDLLQITDSELLRDRLLAYQDDTREGIGLKSVLERIGAFYRTEADVSSLKTVLMAVFGFQGLGTAYTSMNILAVDSLRKLRRAKGSPEVKHLISACVATYGMTPVLADVMRTLGEEHGWRDREIWPEERRTLSSADLDEVKKEIAENIQQQAQDGRLLTQELFDQFIYLWEDIDAEGSRKLFAELTNNGRKFVELLRAYAVRSDPAHFYEKDWWLTTGRNRQGLRVQLVEEFDVESTAITKAEELLDDPPTWLSLHDRELLEAFLRHHRPSQA